MIANVAPRKASGAEKSYTITENIGLLSEAMGAAGSYQILEYNRLPFPNFTIKGTSGTTVPYASTGPGRWQFVMPAEDVTIS
jgi:hypothetical protein|nr:MAG TPA: hypothetical protein [Caudoviricetes sp.]